MDKIEAYAVELTGRPEPVTSNSPLARALRITLGPCGQKLNQHPESYRRDFPNHVLLTEADIRTRTEFLWYGDLDLTNNEVALVQLAQDYRTDLYVTTKRSSDCSQKQTCAVARPTLGSLELRNCSGHYRRGELTRKQQASVADKLPS